MTINFFTYIIGNVTSLIGHIEYLDVLDSGTFHRRRHVLPFVLQPPKKIYLEKVSVSVLPPTEHTVHLTIAILQNPA
jgi:hypothetical protein